MPRRPIPTMQEEQERLVGKTPLQLRRAVASARHALKLAVREKSQAVAERDEAQGKLKEILAARSAFNEAVNKAMQPRSKK